LKDLSFDGTLAGTKLKLKGPIEVRRGLYLLKNQNVDLVWANKDETLKISSAKSFT
jgi:hypothetical protein